MIKFKNMTQTDKMDAYKQIKIRFGLKAKQRDMLDRTAAYPLILEHAANAQWDEVSYWLHRARITS